VSVEDGCGDEFELAVAVARFGGGKDESEARRAAAWRSGATGARRPSAIAPGWAAVVLVKIEERHALQGRRRCGRGFPRARRMPRSSQRFWTEPGSWETKMRVCAAVDDFTDASKALPVPEDVSDAGRASSTMRMSRELDADGDGEGEAHHHAR